MMLRAACVLVVLALAAPCFSQSVDTPPSAKAEEAGYMRGVSFVRAGNWQDSLTAFSSFIARYPASRFRGRASYWMALASLKLDRPGTALSLLTPPAPGVDGSRDPYRSSWILLRGLAQEASGNDPDAAASYRALLDSATPASLRTEAVFRLAGVEYRAGHFSSSRDLYGRILLDSPASPFFRDALFFLAESETALGDMAEAERRYRTLLSLYPDSPYREIAGLRLAEEAWRQGDAELALSRLADESRMFPDGMYKGSVLRIRGDIHLARKEHPQALAAYETAIGILKDGAEKSTTRYSMGVAELQEGNPDDAQKSFGRAAEGPPGALAERASLQQALLLAGLGNVAQARAALQGFIDRYPASPGVEQATRLLAELLEQSGDRLGALRRWDALVQRTPRSAEYLFRRGTTLLELERTAKALDDFQAVVKSFPGSAWCAEAFYSIGYLYARRGEYPRALPYFQAAPRMTSRGDVAERSLFAAAICLFDMGSFDKAIAALQDLRDRQPRGVAEGTVVLYMGKALYRTGRLEPAAQRLREAADLLAAGSSRAARDGDGAEAWYWLAWSLLRLGRVADARDAFLSLAGGYPQDTRRAEAYFRAGICETMRKDDAAALRMFDDAISIAPGSPDVGIREQAMYEKGWALSRLGRAAESAEAFDALRREYPQGRLAAEAFFKQADQALQDGRFDDARKGFARVARDFPGGPLAVRALYWSAEATRRGGDARSSLDGFWSCLQAGPEPGVLFPTLDGFRAAVLEVNDPAVARSYADKAMGAKGLAAEAVAALRLDYAHLLLGSSPSDARGVIEAVQRAVPPEPIAGEASLLLGMYYAATADWGRAIEVFQALERSRADEVGARAVLQHAAALAATGLTADAIDEYLTLSFRFPDLPDLVAEGLFNAVGVARARGDDARATALAQGLRARYAGSPWAARLGGPAPRQ